MKAKSYRDLIAWQKAIDLVVLVYQVTATFPAQEVYGLSSQLRRAAVSIPSNIAEGEGRKAGKEFIRFLRIAYASLQESETQIIIAGKLAYLDDSQVAVLLEKCAEVGRVINGLARSLSANRPH